MLSRRGRLELVVLATLALAVQGTLLLQAWDDGNFGTDFEQTLRPAAEAVAAGLSPYPAYGYPPLIAFAFAPLTLLPGPSLVLLALLAACVPASLWLLGVRDPRCYAASFLWAPVFSSLQTENVTLLLLLGAAATWHVRDRAGRVAASCGLTVAAKLLAWPLGLWLAATGRWRGAVGAALVAVGVTLGLWGLLGFDGLVDYPSSLRGLERDVADDGYTLKALLVGAGLPSGAAGAAGTLLALGTLLGVVAFGRRDDDRRSFTLAVVAAIVATPIVWLHSFALLLAPLALARPRLSVAWLLPVAMLLGSGNGHGEQWQTVLVLGLAAVVVADCLRARPPS